jgi:hypothetical protein
MDSFSASPTGAKYGAFQTEMGNLLAENINSTNIGISIAGFISFGLGTVWFDTNPLLVILLLAFPLFGQINCAYKIVSTMIMRMLELMARITFAPIPIAFSAQQGFSQDAIRYFRGIMACALQPVLMMVGAASIDTITTAVLKIFGFAGSGAATGIPAAIAIGLSYFVLSAYFNETKRLAHEIIAR